MSVGPTTRPRRVLLHIGTMKSGTTFVQQALQHHRVRLEKNGVCFPGRPGYAQQIAAVRDVLDLRGPLGPAEVNGAWRTLLDEVGRWSGHTAVVSVELLSIASPATVTRIVGSFAPAEVHVVTTARDLARVIPSAWQETVQNGLVWTWVEFVASVVARPGASKGPADRFWEQHDLIQLVRRWADVVGPERIHLVTLPPGPAESGELWRRFCQPLEVEASAYPVDGMPVRPNSSLDRDAVELLRLLNERLRAQVSPALYARHVKRGLAKTVLARLPEPRPVVLAASDVEWVIERSERVVQELTSIGVEVVGDLRDLVPAPHGGGSCDPSDAGVARAATLAAAALTRQLADAKDPADEHAGRPERERAGERQ